MDVDELLSRVLDAKLLTEREMRTVCTKVKELLIEESNIQPVNAPVTICGDIHGQFFDVKELLRIGGHPPGTNYIFIGDFVDRGHNSVETIELLFLLKLKYPSHMTLLRGNHESRQITLIYGFYDEISKKYGNPNIWGYCMDVFDHLPLGACVEGEILCIHGGLSPKIKTIDQMRLINRKKEIPNEGPFSDLMWSDPGDVETWVHSSRGAGWVFGARVTKEFNHLNGLNLIARAHQLAQQGYDYSFPEKSLVTIWSAPNYCYRCGNVASIMQVDEKMNRHFEIFREVPESNANSPLNSVLPYFL